MKRTAILISSIFILFTAVAQQRNTENIGFNIENLGLNPPSVSWRKLSTPAGPVIYPKGLDSLAARMAAIINYQRVNDRTVVGRKTTRRVPMIIQHLPILPEGFATPAPWRIETFIVPPQHLFFGPTTWTDMLTIHEYRHAQQFSMARGGFTWVFKPLMGQTGWLLNSLFNQPLWFREGDAVATETQLTKAGRGRLPRFNMETKALLLSGRRFGYEKAGYGISFRDYVPNPYRPGFYMTMKLRKDFGDTIWNKVLHDTYHRGLIYGFAHALKRNTGLKPKDLYESTMNELDSFWKAKETGRNYTTGEIITRPPKKNYVNYRFPQFLPDGSVITLKDALDQVRTFTTLDTAGNEKKMFVHGVYTEDHLMFAAEGNMVCWAETAYDERWGNQSFSVIKIHNTTTGVTKKLSRRTRYFAPAPSHDGSKVAAIQVDALNRSSVVILDAASGKLIREVSIPSDIFLAQPRWFENDRDIIAIAVDTRGNRLVSLNTANGQITDLSAVTLVPFNRPVVKGDYVYVSAGVSGTDDIYALHIATGRWYQVTSSRFGAYEPCISPDGSTMVYSAYTVDGYRLEKMKLDFNWKEVALPRQQPPAQPYVDHSFTSATDTDITDSALNTAYPSTKYRAVPGNPFHFYGWFPYIGPDQFGLEILAQDIMSNVRTSITPFYNANEKALGVKMNVSYAALYPIINIGGGYQTRRGADILDNNGAIIEDQSWKEKFVRAGLVFPFQLTQGRYRSRLELGGYFEHFNVDFLDSGDASIKFRNQQFNAWAATVSFSRLSQTARRHVKPRWGQVARAAWHKSVREIPERITAQTEFYFPGFYPTHSFNLQGSYKREAVVNTYRFAGDFLMPRGYRIEPFEKLWIGSANYELPVWYPDISLGGLAFLQRIRVNVFYDRAEGKRLQSEFPLQSAGGELFIDLRALRLFSMTVGARYAAAVGDSPVKTMPFQVFIGRFELLN